MNAGIHFRSIGFDANKNKNAMLPGLPFIYNPFKLPA